MAHTIIDILTSNDATTDSDYSTAWRQEQSSICRHLQRLLNCRRDSLTHRPDFGMPDIAELYLGLPYTIEIIIACIGYAVQQFEQRINQPRVREFDIKPGSSMTHFELLGLNSSGRPLRYMVSLCRNGRIEVKTSEEYFSHV